MWNASDPYVGIFLMKILRIILVSLVTLLSLGLNAFAADPNGVWKYTAQTPKGQELEFSLTLNWANNQLTGSVDSRAGKVDIRDAKFTDDRIFFTVVRTFRKRELTAHYTGKVEADTIKGTVETAGRDKKPITLPWTATRTK